MVIGTLGKKIVFRVSDQQAVILQSMSREISGRWAEHEAMGAKPKAEFLGAGNQTVKLDIYLSAGLGIRPRTVLEAVEAMVEAGTAEYLIIGNRPVGKNPFRLTGSSETWGAMYSRGQLAKATLSITLEEYT
jgi:hypothetical protein